MEIDILFNTEQKLIKEDVLEILTKNILENVLNERKLSDCEVSVVYVGNEEMQSLNKQYRDEDKVTDTLSFPMNEGEYCDINPSNMLGDIVICIEQANKQAKQADGSLEKEIKLLLVHSILHLLGYDHDTKEKEKEMFDLTKYYLERY